MVDKCGPKVLFYFILHVTTCTRETKMFLPLKIFHKSCLQRKFAELPIFKADHGLM